MDDNNFAWNHGYSCAASSDINLSKNPFATGLNHLAWNFGFAFFQTEKVKAKFEAESEEEAGKSASIRANSYISHWDCKSRWELRQLNNDNTPMGFPINYGEITKW